jgi:uncharacterized protein YbjT (DUF2867 family)
MKIVIIGGSGLIGSKVVRRLAERGHEPLVASPSRGIDVTTGEGLVEALKGAEVVVDVSNSPSFEDAAALSFFEQSSGNLAEAEGAAGVRHHVALSVVGLERLPASGYFRAKLAQETLLKASGIPFTIVRATQFMEFIASIAAAAPTIDGELSLPDAVFQPIAAEDVAGAVAEAALAKPRNGTVEIAGPEKLLMSEAVGRYLRATGETRRVVADPAATYFGAVIDDASLVPADATVGSGTPLNRWLTTFG